MYFETHKDDHSQAVGSHEGADASASLHVKDANFDRYLTVGVVCYNTTQDANGLVTALTRNTLTVDGVTWDNGDEYEIYLTDTKDSFISKIAIDKIYGRKL